MSRKIVLFSLIFLLLLSAAFSFTPCASSAECATGESCSPANNRCYLSDFAYTKPSLMQMDVGESRVFTVLMSSPLSQSREFDLRLSGEGRYFARFVGNTPTISVVLTNETKKIPIFFKAGVVGDHAVCVEALDPALPEVNNTHPLSKACTTFMVKSGSKGMFTLSTPSLGTGAIIFLALLASGLFVLIEMKRGERKR